jgi:hypothetical protein
MSADVKTYSILMFEDDVFMIKMLKAYRQILSDYIGSWKTGHLGQDSFLDSIPVAWLIKATVCSGKTKARHS